VLSFRKSVAPCGLLGVLSGHHWAAAAVPHVTLVDVCCTQARNKAAMRWVFVAAVFAYTLLHAHKNGDLERLHIAVFGLLVSFSSSVFGLLDLYEYVRDAGVVIRLHLCTLL
jgi:hypothetical protein